MSLSNGADPVASFIREAAKRTRTGATPVSFYTSFETRSRRFSSSGESLGIADSSAIPVHLADRGVSPGKAAKPT